MDEDFKGSDLEDEYEAVWIQVQLRKTKYLISRVYRAPDESLEVFDYLNDVMCYATCQNFEVIILGDMNCNVLDSSQRPNARLVEFLAANELTQMVTEPTCVTNNSSSLLDILITTKPAQFKDVGTLGITLSDQLPHICCHECTQRSTHQASYNNNPLLVRGRN